MKKALPLRHGFTCDCCAVDFPAITMQEAVSDAFNGAGTAADFLDGLMRRGFEVVSAYNQAPRARQNDPAITDKELFDYCDKLPRKQWCNVDAMLYANHRISRDRSLAIAKVWLGRMVAAGR